MIRTWTILRRKSCETNLRGLSRSGRWYSTSSPAERVSVSCQSNGSVDLDIYYPLKPPEQSSPRAVLVYLPRGPFLTNTEHDASTVSVLQSSLACPVVQINYRLNREQPFPTPVHDALAGYDWILENMLPRRSITRAGRSEHVGKLGVCGELIGGGLAAALALTECRAGEPGVVAAAVNNPIVDWVSLDAGAARGKTTMASTDMKSSSSSIHKLISLRGQLFRKPEHFFDPFASPILLFRSAGVEVPAAPAFDTQDDLEHLSMLEWEDFHRQDSGMDDTSTVQQGESGGARTKRKSSRRFPSKALGLRLPSFSVSAGLASPLKLQADELTLALRQSMVRQSQQVVARSSGFGRKVLEDDEEDEMDEDEQRTRQAQKAEAEEKVKLQLHRGMGLWDNSEHGKARILEVSKWFKTVLE